MNAIDIIDYRLDITPGSLYIAWDLNGADQPDFAPTTAQLLEILMNLEYIFDYSNPNGGDIIVALMIDGRKEWVEWERWLADEACDRLAMDIIEYAFKNIIHA